MASAGVDDQKILAVKLQCLYKNRSGNLEKRSTNNKDKDRVNTFCN